MIQLSSTSDLSLNGIASPTDFYRILRSPAPLAGMRSPSSDTPWHEIHAAGFDYVVCLTTPVPDYNPTPLRVLHAVALEDLWHGRPPARPDAEEVSILEAVRVVSAAIYRSVGVVVHCLGGTGRTGTVLGGVLVTLGVPLATVTAYLREVNQTREGRTWPESPWQHEVLVRLSVQLLNE